MTSATAAGPTERYAASWMAVGTLLSRLTGFVRTAALVAVLGVTSLGNAYNTANTVPNMLLFLVTGGTISAVLIPMLAREEDVARRRHVAETIGGLILLLTVAACVAMLVTAPLLARLFALRVGGDAAAFVSVTTRWLLLFAPQVVCYGVSVYAVAVLNAHGRLALAGFTPVATNLVAIAAAVGYVLTGGPRSGQITELPTLPLVVLGVGTTLSVAAMAVPQLLGARRVLPGLRLRPTARFGDPAARQLWQLGRWTLLYVAVNQAGLFVVVTLANGVEGGTVAYQTAFAIMQLPFAIIAVSLFSAIYPRLSRAAGQTGKLFGATVSGGLRLSNALLIPSAVGLGVLAAPIADLLVGYGVARGSGADFVAVALRVFALALVPFTIFQLLTRGYYALPDTRVPALVNVAVNLVNVVAAFAAFTAFSQPRAQIAGLVGSFALSYVAGCLLLGLGLARRRSGCFAGAARATATAVAASAVMALALSASAAAWPPSQQVLAGFVRTGVLVALGGVVYLAVAWALRSPELGELLKIRRS